MAHSANTALLYKLLKGQCALDTDTIHIQMWENFGLSGVTLDNMSSAIGFPVSPPVAIDGRYWKMVSGAGWTIATTTHEWRLENFGRVFNNASDGNDHFEFIDIVAFRPSDGLFLDSIRSVEYANAIHGDYPDTAVVQPTNGIFASLSGDGSMGNTAWGHRMVLSGSLNWEGLPWSVKLIDDNYTGARSAVKYLSDIPSSRWVGGVALTGRSVSFPSGRLFADDCVVSAGAGRRLGSLAVYQDTGNPQTSLVFRVAPLDEVDKVTTNGQPIYLSWAAFGFREPIGYWGNPSFMWGPGH